MNLRINVHGFHEGMPGYLPAQILYDGCRLCENRGQHPDSALANLDMANFIRAWRRAAQWQRHGVSDISEAEAPLLRTLWAVQVKLEQLGLPIGQLPAGPDDAV